MRSSEAYTLDSKSRETYLTVGFSHYLSRRFEQAISVWVKLLQSNPDVVQSYTQCRLWRICAMAN